MFVTSLGSLRRQWAQTERTSQTKYTLAVAVAVGRCRQATGTQTHTQAQVHCSLFSKTLSAEQSRAEQVCKESGFAFICVLANCRLRSVNQSLFSLRSQALSALHTLVLVHVHVHVHVSFRRKLTYLLACVANYPVRVPVPVFASRWLNTERWTECKVCVSRCALPCARFPCLSVSIRLLPTAFNSNVSHHFLPFVQLTQLLQSHSHCVCCFQFRLLFTRW